jgi:hypothetical protein
MGTVARGRTGISRRQTGSREQQARWLRQYVDSLNYFYYLLSLPPDAVPRGARLRPQARDRQPLATAPMTGMPESQLTEWDMTLSKL